MGKRRNTLFSGVLIAVISMVVGLVIAGRLDMVSRSVAQTSSGSQAGGAGTSGLTVLPEMNSAPITGQLTATTFRDIAEAQSPMVVNIRTETRSSQGGESNRFFGDDDLFRRFFLSLIHI